MSSSYNDPFYFAVPRRSATSPMSAAVHIERTFGISGTVEVMREELAFTLCRISGHDNAEAAK